MENPLRHALTAVLLGAAALVAGCSTAPATNLEMSWVAPQLPPGPMKKLLIITVASEEFVQVAFQNQMATELKARGVNAVASRRYFTRYTDAERARFKQSIDESGADYVLLARMTRSATTENEDRGRLIGANGVPYADATAITGAYARYFSPTSYVQGGDYTMKTVFAEASIFALDGQKLIWSARTKTTNAHRLGGEEAATQYVPVLLEALKKDKLLRN